MAFGAKSEARKVSAAEAAALVKSGMWLDWGFGLCQPDKFDAALAARKDALKGVKIRACLSMRSRHVLECDPDGTHFQWFNWHFSGYDRKHHDGQPWPGGQALDDHRIPEQQRARGRTSQRQEARRPRVAGLPHQARDDQRDDQRTD